MPEHLHPQSVLNSAAYLFFIALLLLSCGMGRHPGAGTLPLTLEALYAQCGLPAACDARPACDGRQATIAAQLDPANIFDREHYPQLPYEKFKLIDGRGRSVEVWPQAADNRPIFEKLASRPSDRLVVHGRLAAVKMPIMGTCKQGIKVLIDAADQIEFQE